MKRPPRGRREEPSLTLYAIVDARCAPPRGRGISGAPLGSVVVGSARFVFERAAPPEPTAAALQGFDRVVRRLFARCPAVLPFRFGAKARGVDAIVELFGESDRAIAGALARVRNRVQFTHRVWGEAAKASKPKGTRAGGPGTRWLDARAVLQRLPEVAPLREVVARLVRAVRVERADRPPLVGTFYALVPASKAAVYQRTVTNVVEALAARGIRVETTGPWPAYAFADLW